MNIYPADSRQSQIGSAEYFIGTAHVEMLNSPAAPARALTALVTFEPGARNNWHTHPFGQTLVVVSGTGWVQCEGEEKVEVTEGDVVWFPPGQKHWHGATATSAMAHYAITEADEGRSADWLEPVSDDQYASGRR